MCMLVRTRQVFAETVTIVSDLWSHQWLFTTFIKRKLAKPISLLLVYFLDKTRIISVQLGVNTNVRHNVARTQQT